MVTDIVSGSVPAEHRKVLLDIVAKQRPKYLIIESARALARSTVAGEQLFQCAQDAGVIIAADSPELFTSRTCAW